MVKRRLLFIKRSDSAPVYFPLQGHHVAGVHWGALCGGERQPAAGRPTGDRILGVPAAALTCASGGSEACGCGNAAPRTQTTSHLCTA